MIETLCQLIGLVLIVVAAGMVAVPLGVAVAGVALLAVGVVRELSS